MIPSHLIDKVRTALGDRQYAYRKVFANPLGKVVLADLARFCRANESTFHPEHSISDRLDGRREVWLRIVQHIKLTPEELFELYRAPE